MVVPEFPATSRVFETHQWYLWYKSISEKIEKVCAKILEKICTELHEICLTVQKVHQESYKLFLTMLYTFIWLQEFVAEYKCGETTSCKKIKET